MKFVRKFTSLREPMTMLPNPVFCRFCTRSNCLHSELLVEIIQLNDEEILPHKLLREIGQMLLRGCIEVRQIINEFIAEYG